MELWNILAKIINYDELSDEKLVILAQANDQIAMEHIINKYAGFVKTRSGPFFLAGAEREDLIQEGMIGLYEAIKSYNDSKKASFKTFAGVCIVRRMITAVKFSTRKKNTPLNHYVSIHGTDKDTGWDSTFGKLVDLKNVNPESILIEKESAKGMELEISKLLSNFENEVLNLYLSGMSYKEIAARLGRESKAVDNALTRIKKKIENHISEV